MKVSQAVLGAPSILTRPQGKGGTLEAEAELRCRAWSPELL